MKDLATTIGTLLGHYLYILKEIEYVDEYKEFMKKIGKEDIDNLNNIMQIGEQISQGKRSVL